MEVLRKSIEQNRRKEGSAARWFFARKLLRSKKDENGYAQCWHFWGGMFDGFYTILQSQHICDGRFFLELQVPHGHVVFVGRFCCETFCKNKWGITSCVVVENSVWWCIQSKPEPVLNCCQLFLFEQFLWTIHFARRTSSKLFQSVKSYFDFAHETFEGPTVFFGMRYVFKQRCTKNAAKPVNPRSFIYSQKI